MRLCLLTISVTVLAVTSTLAQQQPGINIPLPNVPGVTTPNQPQRGYPPQGQPYDRGGDYRQTDPGRTGSQGGRCADLASEERDIRDRLNDAPRSGREHDQLVYQLGQVRNQQQRCR
jgi:hypothetical protein